MKSSSHRTDNHHASGIFFYREETASVCSSLLHWLRNTRPIYLFFGAALVVYFVVMDTILYRELQTHRLLEVESTISYSPFSPLSIKLLLSNYIEHYIYSPLSEYFDIFTKFSKIFYFITPNMITFTHFIMAVISGRLAMSESLYRRRIAVILFEFRSWLDTLDGTVYRSHTADKIYTSHPSQLGYYVDIIADTVGGVCFCLGLWWYITKKIMPQTAEVSIQKSLEEGIQNSADERHPATVKYTKKYLFWIIWKYGFLIFISSGAWTLATKRYEDVFEVALQGEERQVLQLEILRSNTTWFIFWLWRMLEGQVLLHIIVFVTYIDKVWEFLNVAPMYGYTAFVGLNLLTHAHIHMVRVQLGL